MVFFLSGSYDESFAHGNLYLPPQKVKNPKFIFPMLLNLD